MRLDPGDKNLLFSSPYVQMYMKASVVGTFLSKSKNKASK